METGDVLRPSAADASVRPAGPGDVPLIAAVQARSLRAAYADLLDPEVLTQLTPAALVPAWAEAAESTRVPSRSNRTAANLRAARPQKASARGASTPRR